MTRHFESGEYLLVSNKIRIKGSKVPTEELLPYIQQQPNGKFLGIFRINIALYNIGNKGDETKFRKWLKNKPGEAPVLLDTSLVSSSAKQMEMYLANKGFFHSKVSDTIYFRKKKASVIYRVDPGEPYRIRNIRYAIPDTQVAALIFRDTAQTLIKKGNNYDSYVFDDERTRITSYLLNEGYYKFSSNYIKYTIDTNLHCKQLDLTLEIVNDVVPTLFGLSGWKIIPHRRYYINNVYIYPEYDHVTPYKGKYDTIVKTYYADKKENREIRYCFLNHTPFMIKPRTIAQSVYITPLSHYNLDDVNQTYNQLSGLQVFKYINLQFRDCPPGERKKSSVKDIIDCHIELSRKPEHSFAVTTDGTNSSGALGVQANLGYQNCNIFSGAQLLRINLNGSLQMQATDGFGGKTFFNTIEVGANAGLTFPQFLVPFKTDNIHKDFNPKTNISIGYNYQLQEHYNRHISNITFGYTWGRKKQIQHLLNPIEISLVKIFKDSYFDSVLNSQQDNRLKNQYTDHLVAGAKYTFTYNSQQVTKSNNFVWFRLNLETGGNFLYLLNTVFNGKQVAGSPFSVQGLPFAQFVRPDVDFRYYQVLRKNFSFVYRFYAGIGIPYGNVTVLPFEKTFFAGGANGMRGWRMYSLGPGEYINTQTSATFNQIGDMQLEANFEYRFPIYDWIRGAFYIDAGNIWLLKDSPDLPGGKFIFPDFLDQVAIDSGIGLRFDFDFFIFRFDPAIALRNPVYTVSERWTFNKLQLKDIVWNFGIGYPF